MKYNGNGYNGKGLQNIGPITRARIGRIEGMLLNGEVSSQTEISEREGIKLPYVCRIIDEIEDKGVVDVSVVRGKCRFKGDVAKRDEMIKSGLYSDTEIGNEFGISREAIRQHRRRYHDVKECAKKRRKHAKENGGTLGSLGSKIPGNGRVSSS